VDKKFGVIKFMTVEQITKPKELQEIKQWIYPFIRATGIEQIEKDKKDTVEPSIETKTIKYVNPPNSTQPIEPPQGYIPSKIPATLVQLRERVKQKQVLAIIGAGVSIAATDKDSRASWTGLLENGITFCLDWAKQTQDWAKRVGDEIKSGDIDDLLSAATKISAKLGYPGGGDWSRWLRESVGALHATQRDAISALACLGIPLATTNYDGLIEEVTKLRPVTWKDRKVVERVIRGDEERVIHLHGYWEDSESVVLGIKSYDQLLGDKHAQAQLRALLFTRTFLFVGCGAGMHDPNFGALLRWAREVFSGSEYSHYRLALKSEIHELEQEHHDDKIIVEAFGEKHEELGAFLRGLVPPD
jgi:hypothetical protein